MAASFLLCAGANAQEEPLISPTAGPDSPYAQERESARATLSEKERLDRFREALRSGEHGGQIVDAIIALAAKRDKADIALIAPFIVHIEPDIAYCAMQALRGYGRDALATVEALGSDIIDGPTRKKVREQLLKDHIYACCQRDRAVNPYQIDYEARIDELYAINNDIDNLMLNMLRDAIPVIRQDLMGMYYNRRYYYYGYQVAWEPEFIEYGALVIAALHKRQPEVLKREVQELSETSKDNRGYYYSWQMRQPVTRELCFVFARMGKTEPLLQLIADLEQTTRWGADPATMASVHVEIASCMMGGGVFLKQKGADPVGAPRGAFDAAMVLERLDAAIGLAGPSGQPVASHARYLKARQLMQAGDDGGALRELEEAMEASESPLLMVSVDSAFSGLAAERRFQTVLAYAELIARRAHESQRPYRAAKR